MRNIIYITALWTILLASSCVEDECETAKECGPNQTCVESGGVLFGGKICADIDGTGAQDMPSDMVNPDPDMMRPDMTTDMSTPDVNDMGVPDSGVDMTYDMTTPDMEGDMPCIPLTQQDLCEVRGLNCGGLDVTDNCGETRPIDCGECPAPETCGGGAPGIANNCGCTPESNEEFCARNGKDCGTFIGTDNCGIARTANCGPCSGGTVCGQSAPNVCGCPCNIGGTCYADGAVNPSNECQACRPAISTTSWSNRASGTSCDDGNPCTLNDTCDSSGLCVSGAPRICPQSEQCQTGVCNVSTGQCGVQNDPNGSPCNDGNACTQSDSCQNGACVGANEVLCSDPGQCRSAACNPSTGSCVTSNDANGTSCDDGLFCTVLDSCSNGSCEGTPRDCNIQGVFCARTCDDIQNRCVKADPQCVEP